MGIIPSKGNQCISFEWPSLALPLFFVTNRLFSTEGKFQKAQTALKWAQKLWSDTLANEAGPPAAIYSKASDLHTCMARQLHYQSFDIPVILHKTLTSFHLPNPPFVETRAVQRKAHGSVMGVFRRVYVESKENLLIKTYFKTHITCHFIVNRPGQLGEKHK